MSMIRFVLWAALLLGGGLLTSCNQENFEKMRQTADPATKLKRAMEFYEQKEYLKAQTLLEDLIGAYRGDARAEQVYFYYAYTHFHLKNFNFANYYFKQFHNTYPNSNLAEEALFMSAQASYMLSPNYRLTQEDTYKAIEGMQLFVNLYPNSSRVTEANQKMDELRAKTELKALETAKGYYHRRHYKAAQHTFKALLVDFPETKNVEYIRYMILKSSYKFALESVLDKQVERLQETIQGCQLFLKKYSNGEYGKDIRQIVEQSNQRINHLNTIKNERNKAKSAGN